jgi:hypothetical protein
MSLCGLSGPPTGASTSVQLSFWRAPRTWRRHRPTAERSKRQDGCGGPSGWQLNTIETEGLISGGRAPVVVGQRCRRQRGQDARRPLLWVTQHTARRDHPAFVRACPSGSDPVGCRLSGSWSAVRSVPKAAFEDTVWGLGARGPMSARRHGDESTCPAVEVRRAAGRVSVVRVVVVGASPRVGSFG